MGAGGAEMPDPVALAAQTAALAAKNDAAAAALVRRRTRFLLLLQLPELQLRQLGSLLRRTRTIQRQ